jgi:hypothetical protein
MNKTYTASFSTIDVGDVQIINNKDRYLYDPKEDIANIELALLLRLFTVVAAGQGVYNYDAFGFIEKHNLQRHFKKVGNS